MEQCEWHEILNENDIADLFDAYGGFHDSCIVSVNYTSGMCVDKEASMHFEGANSYELHMIFHSQWSEYALELCFNGVRRLRLVGAQDNCDNDIFGASVKFYDNILPSQYQTPPTVIVWGDSEDFDITDIDAELSEPADSYVIAHSLKWRLLDKK